jgi:hypothetical protein
MRAIAGGEQQDASGVREQLGRRPIEAGIDVLDLGCTGRGAVAAPELTSRASIVSHEHQRLIEFQGACADRV